MRACHPFLETALASAAVVALAVLAQQPAAPPPVPRAPAAAYAPASEVFSAWWDAPTNQYVVGHRVVVSATTNEADGVARDVGMPATRVTFTNQGGQVYWIFVRQKDDLGNYGPAAVAGWGFTNWVAVRSVSVVDGRRVTNWSYAGAMRGTNEFLLHEVKAHNNERTQLSR